MSRPFKEGDRIIIEDVLEGSPWETQRNNIVGRFAVINFIDKQDSDGIFCGYLNLEKEVTCDCGCNMTYKNRAYFNYIKIVKYKDCTVPEKIEEPTLGSYFRKIIPPGK